RAGGRHRAHPDPLPRNGRRRQRRSRRSSRSHGRCRHLGIPAHSERPVAPAGAFLAAALPADAGCADHPRAAACHLLHVVARSGHGGGNPGGDRGSRESGGAARADASRRAAAAPRRREYRHAVDAGGDAPESGERDDALAPGHRRKRDQDRVTFADKYACAELIQAWGHHRDQGRWTELSATFAPEGEIAVSWFRGPFGEFVAQCRRSFAAGNRSEHLIWPSTVRLAPAGAAAENNGAILVRQALDGTRVDLTSYARFVDRLERRDRWMIVERAAVYEQDRLAPVQPSEAFDTMMRPAVLARFPA